MAIGLIAGGWLATAVISKLIAEIVELAKNHKKKLGLKGELARLDKGLPKIKAVLKDVDQGIIREMNEDLEEWLWQLRDAADQAEDVMDEIKYYLVKEKVEAKNKVSDVKVFLGLVLKGDPILKKLKKTVKVIDNVVSDIGNFIKIVDNLVENQKEAIKLANSNRQTGSLVNANTVYGREKEKEDIINKLLNPKCETKGVNFAVLPIIGQGGIGKTTLAQAVYNDPIVQNHFKLKMWVHISNKFDKVFLVKKLYQSVLNENAIHFDEYSLIERKVYDKLQSQRFLVVFDDAWNDNDKAGWDSLITPLKSGSSGSMILLTTRMKTIAPLIKHNLMESVYLGQLEEHNIWNLLKECVFGDKDARCDKQLEILGRQITKKLKGSPLAAKAVGGMLSSKLDDQFWRSISESELWCLDQNPDGIMPALRLTYEHLPPHLKPCFSFCSIFPPDHIFIKDDLINMWVALGLVPRHFNRTKRPEDVGSEYFEDMLNRSIFSVANPVRNAHLQYPAYTYCSTAGKQFVGGYIMHDLMHDLSSFVSQGECNRSYIDELATIPSTVRHLYIQVKAQSELRNFNFENIRTLILHFEDSDHPKLDDTDHPKLDETDHPKLDEIVNEILEKSKCLRVLAVFALKLGEFPKSACDLLHLRYLSLSSFNIKEFPISMSKLYFLETMVCGGLGIEKPSQAAGLVELINLRHLIVSEDFVETIAGISRLTSLQELSCRVAKNCGFKICELKDMLDLRRLSISNVGGINSHEEAIEANLGNKVNLSKLSLQWESNNLDRKVFEHLEPHCNLRELKIRNYMGGRFPPWLTKQAFSNLEVLTLESLGTMEEWSLTEQPNNRMCCLRELTIDDCPNLLVLPSLPASLKKLKLQGLGLFYLPDLLKDHTSEPGGLPSLVSMEITDCPNLASLAEGFFQNPEQFTSLQELIIMNCEELETPPDGFSKYISLKRLDISDCPKIKLSFVHRFSMSSTLQFFRIDNHVEDIQAEMRHDDNARELSLQYVPTLQTEEAKLVVFGLSQPFPKLELRFSSMRSYMGRWSRDWLTQNLPHLEYLNIDGYPKFNEYCSEKLPEEVKQLMRIICRGSSTNFHKISKIQMVQKIYLVTEKINGIQCLKRLSVAIQSRSWVMPHIPVTLKELRLSNLGLIGLKSLRQSPSSQCRSLPSLVKIEISHCSNLVWSTGFHDQFAAVKELIISNHCSWSRMKGFIDFISDFISLERLDICDCPEITRWFEHEVSCPSTLKLLPSTLQFLRIDSYVKDIQKEIGKNDIIYQSSLQSGPTLQTEEAELLVFDHVWGSLDLELRFPDMRNYTGRWLPAWLKDLSIVESLCIAGEISHFSERPNGMDRLLKDILEGRNSYYPCLEIGYPSDLAVIKQSYLVMQNNKITQRLKKLTVALYSSSCVMPPLSFTLKELKLHHLGLVVLPYLYGNKSSDSGSLPSLVSMEISNCPNLLSLAEGLFQKPQQFAVLEKLEIRNCEKLRELPQGGFNKFVSLKELKIEDCPMIEGQRVPECFLPSAIQVLYISYCGVLDATLTKALESVQSLISLELKYCAKITSLPPKEVFSRWDTLKKLELTYCYELTSLESLLGLSSVRLLIIRDCPKLVSAMTSPSASKKDEIEGMVEEGTIQTLSRPAPTQPAAKNSSGSMETERDKDEATIQTLYRVDEVKKCSPARSWRVLTIFQCLWNLCTLFFSLVKMFLPRFIRTVPAQPPSTEAADERPLLSVDMLATEEIAQDGTIQTLSRPSSTQPTPKDPSSSTNTEHKPLISVDELKIDYPLLLSIEPIRNLSFVRKLTIEYCPGMESLPELPSVREELSLELCSPELKRRCEESGEDWPKLSHIPKVSISGLFDTDLTKDKLMDFIWAQQEDLECSQPH